MLQRLWALRDGVEHRLLVSYCDTFIDLDIDSMLVLHRNKGAAATIVTAEIRNPFGLVTVNEQGWVDSFVEKPLLNYYIGSFVLEKTAFSLITQDMLDRPDGEGLIELFCMLAKKKLLAAFPHKGTQITFNTESERRTAERDLGHFYTYEEDG
jgi:NDP-sugar pyrophosphorylase family protein